jgi:Arc/MetJ-type ribon-helix-helix transcriptional regulator
VSATNHATYATIGSIATEKLSVTVEAKSVRQLDRWVHEGRYRNRSQAIQAGIDLLERRNALPTLDEALAAYRLLPPESKARLDAEAEAIERFFDQLAQWPKE